MCGVGCDDKQQVRCSSPSPHFNPDPKPFLSTTSSQTAYGVTVAGEFSNAINDCGLYLNGIRNTHTYGGDCALWEEASRWDDATKEGLMTFAMASFDSLQNWFFWTWKVRVFLFFPNQIFVSSLY